MARLNNSLLLSLVLAAGLAGAAPAAVHAAELVGADPAIASLQAGDYVWRPELSTEGPVNIVVDLGLQTASVYRGGVLIATSSVSTGKTGHETPAGTYSILEKAVMHHSNLYNNAAMPFMQRLGWDGLALHAGNIPGYPASHGCVRLPIAFAKKLYGVTQVGATVTITGVASAPAEPAPAAVTPAAPVVSDAPADLPAAILPAAEPAADITVRAEALPTTVASNDH